MAERVRQDMPPPGGYRPVHFARTFPKLVWKPAWVCAAGVGCMIIGYNQTWYRKKQDIGEKFEDIDYNVAMEPFLKAERDRRWLSLLRKNYELEKAVMKDVPGWKVGTWYGEPVYFTVTEDQWWDPSWIEALAHTHDEHRSNEMEYWAQAQPYGTPKWIHKFVPDWLLHFLVWETSI